MQSAKKKSSLEKAYIEIIPHLKEAEKRLSNTIAMAASEIEDKYLVRIRVRETRIKTFQSIQRKSRLHKYSEEEALYRINDLVGIRMVCNNTEDVYRFYEIFVKSLSEEEVISIEDFLIKPQTSGYRALHISFYIEVGSAFSIRRIPCELQIRTLLQDSWAELTHSDIYKSETDLPEDLKGRMEDLASILSAADEIAQRVRKRISRDFNVSGPVDLNRVTGEGLAYIFQQIFGKSPSEYFVQKCEQQCRENKLESLKKLEEILQRKAFRETARERYKKVGGFGLPPEPELIFLAGLKAAEQDEEAGFRHIKTIAREEREETESYWRNEVLSQLPETVQEFIDEIKSLNIEEIAEVWGVADSCMICGTTIIDPDTFFYQVAENYGVDDSSDIFSELIGLDVSWGEDGLCSYHAYQEKKDK